MEGNLCTITGRMLKWQLHKVVSNAHWREILKGSSALAEDSSELSECRTNSKSYKCTWATQIISSWTTCMTQTKHSQSQMQTECGQHKHQHFTLTVSTWIIYISRAGEGGNGLRQAQQHTEYGLTEWVQKLNTENLKKRNAKITVFYWSTSKGLVIIP